MLIPYFLTRLASWGSVRFRLA